ncbi:MAG: LUD domain-containing protein [Candidatus Omnitrophica bacterium]|nr:LUD domain-containing protein [Candidatus Omnitrophota bacterium]
MKPRYKYGFILLKIMSLEQILVSERIKNAKKSLEVSLQTYLINRNKAFENNDIEKIKKELKRIKEFSINNLEELKNKTVKNLKEQGIKVFEAKDIEEAKKIVLDIIPKGELVVKSKSNAINEIGLESALKKRNKIIETDCGDFIVQICEENSTHPITPALHIPIEKIIQKINEKFKAKIEKSPEKIIEWIRKYLKKEILKSKISLTGANVISSDGGIFILENEGNISLISRLVEKHIIITGIEKIVPSVQDAMFVCQALAIWGSGISLPTYINVISSPSKTADIQKEIVWGAHGPREVYLILLDNGRTESIKNGFKEMLYCINCGSCLYFCPVYRQIFDNYGLNYFGGIGVIKLFFSNGLKKTIEKGLHYCTTCQGCKVNCPLDINVSELIKKLREVVIEKGLETENNKKMIENLRAYGNPFGKIEEGKIPKQLYCC